MSKAKTRPCIVGWDKVETAGGSVPHRDEPREFVGVAYDRERVLGNLSDAELLQVGEVADLLKHHDWYYSFRTDPHMNARGHEQRLIIDAALATLPFDQARAIWETYAPAALGSYRRP